MDSRLIVSVIDNLESTSSTDALSANMGRALDEAKQDVISDSGWITLTLLNGAVAYNVAQTPQYRKIGNKVYIRGVYKGVTEMPLVIAQLPEGYRPSMRVIFMQSGTGSRVDRMEIETTGEVKFANCNDGEPLEETWHSLHWSFLTD